MPLTMLDPDEDRNFAEGETIFDVDGNQYTVIDGHACLVRNPAALTSHRHQALLQPRSPGCRPLPRLRMHGLHQQRRHDRILPWLREDPRMRQKTIAQRLAEGLIARGCTEVTSSTRRYRTFNTSPPGREFFFVGRGGSLRCGRNISTSIACHPRALRADLLAQVPA